MQQSRQIHRVLACLVGAFGLTVTLAGSCPAQAGFLDSTFGDGGKVTTDFLGPSQDGGASVALQADGKLVVAGHRSSAGGNDFALVRFNTDGSLDAAFGTGGSVATDFGNPDTLAFAVAIQADGKIVAVGESWGQRGQFALVRYNGDGSLDTSFGGDGRVTTSIGVSSDRAHAVAIQSDGKIVVAGSTRAVSLDDFALARYNTDGTLDSSFGTGGTVITDVARGASDAGESVAIQADGRIVVAGRAQVASTSGYQFAVVRYNADGSLDTGFDADGIALTNFASGPESAYAVVVQADGKIVVGGEGQQRFAVARYEADGSLDLGFGSNGTVTTSVGGSIHGLAALAIQSDGRIVAAGAVGSQTTGDFGLARYNVDGSLDTTFDSDGTLTTSIGPSGDSARALAIQSDGKIVAAGGTRLGPSADFALARYDVDGSLDLTFDADGKVTIDVGGPLFDFARDIVAMQADGKILVAGSNSTVTSSLTAFALARYNSDGTLDATFGSGGQVRTEFDRRAAASAIAIQADGRIVAVGHTYVGANRDFALVRYHADGSLDSSFDGDGRVTTSIGPSTDLANDVAIQADGKIVVVGTSFFLGGVVARYNSDGSLDLTFDGDGVAANPLLTPEAVVIGADGKIIVAGPGNDFVLARYHPDGSLDTTFVRDGISLVFDVAIQTDGRIIAAGRLGGPGFDAFALVRYHPNGILDTSFGGDGKVATTIGVGGEARAVVVQGDGRIVATGLASMPSAGYPDFATVRYNPDGTPDTGFGTNGIVTTDFAGGPDQAWGIALHGGNIVVGGEADNAGTTGRDFGLARYLGVTDVATALEQLAQDVEVLAGLGVLNHGQARSLEAKLEAAIHQVDNGNDGAAVNKLQAVMSELNALVSAGILTPAQAQPVYDRAAALVNALS